MVASWAGSTASTGVEFCLLVGGACLGNFGPVARTLDLFEGEHVFKGGTLGLDFHHLVVELFTADKAVFRLTVVEDVLVILLRHGGVDRNVNRTRLHDGVVHDVPLAAVVVADERHFFLRLEPHGNEATRHRIHFFHKLGGGIRHAVAVLGMVIITSKGLVANW